MGTRSGRGPVETGARGSSPRELTVRAYLHRWAETAGAHLLVVDPQQESETLSEAMAARGVHVTWVGTTTDGLIEFGRHDPQAVVVAPDAPGLPAPEFVGAMMRYGAPYVVAAMEHAHAADVSAVMLAGASAVVTRPYSAPELWELLNRSPRSLDEHARVSVGPIELDAGAYQVTIDGCRIADLPLKEFELLRTLMLRSPGVVTDDELRSALWGTAARRPSGNTIAMHVTRLRNRLGGVADIRRIRGRGYSLTVG